MDPVFYEGEAAKAIPDPADHPVARRRNVWTDVEEMRARFADRPPYANWDPRVLADYCTYGLLPAAEGEGFELACPPALEASVYQNALRTNPHEWLHYLSVPSRSEEHTSELQSLMRISYAVFCLKKKQTKR